MKTQSAVSGAFALGAALGLCITVIYLQKQGDSDYNDKGKGIDEARKILMSEISPTNIEENLRRLASKPHIAGRDVDEKELVGFISESWQNAGLDVNVHGYEMLLSYPNDNDPNYVALKNEDGEELFKSKFQEKILDASMNVSGRVKPYSAYSPPGEPEGDLVYVNFAKLSDFLELNNTLSIDVRGKICIARQGSSGRASKAKFASWFGCKGLIMYPDPSEYTVPGKGVYPDDWYMPGSAVRYGGLLDTIGDPLTLNYPAIETSWKTDTPLLPTIPVIPISYDDARKYLAKMDGPEAPESWRGKLNITYKLGPGFIDQYSDRQMRMHVVNHNEVKKIHNVIGFIRGKVEPDRYVILGNHRDAWEFGTLDPSSGTAVMLELARVLGLAVKGGWKPKRTIVFCSWGAEEFGLGGSTEWVEEFQKVLGSRAVAYLNVDSSVVGTYSMYGMASPNMKEMLFEAAKLIPNPNKEEIAFGLETLFDAWKMKLPSNPGDPNSAPRVLLPSSGSDYAPFKHLTGISFVDVAFIWNPTLGLDFYPVYHTVYETLDLMKKYVDPNFLRHQAIGRLWGELALRFSESALLPLNCVDYAKQIITGKDQLLGYFGKNMENNGIDISLLTKAADELLNEAKNFHERLEKVDLNNMIAVRAANDQLVQFERAFIDARGIEGQSQYRHVIFSPSQHQDFGSFLFPGLVDSMFGIDTEKNQTERWNYVKKQYSIIIYHLGSAASTLRDFTPIIGASNEL